MNVKTQYELLCLIDPVVPDSVRYVRQSDVWYLGFVQPSDELDFVRLDENRRVEIVTEFEGYDQTLGANLDYIVIRIGGNP